MASSKTTDLGLLSFFIFCCCSIISPYVQANDEATNIDNLKKYRCVFLHGIGYLGSGPANSSDVEGYWGGDDIVRENTPQCSSWTFAHQDTVHKAWDDIALVQAFCDAAINGKANSIDNTLVFSHSFGNLVFARGLDLGTCLLSNSSKWISMSAPWRGSKAASMVVDMCLDNGIFDKSLKKLADLLDWQYCDASHQPNVAYASLVPTYPGFQANIAIAERFVSYGLCGTSSWGITSEYSPLLEALSKFVGFDSENDAMVTGKSCGLPSKKYGDTYDSAFLKTKINHVDGTGRTGKLENSIVRQWMYQVGN